MTVDLSKVTLASQLKGETAAEASEIKDLLAEAASYLESFKWCKSINTAYGGIVIPGVVGVFLFNLIPAQTMVDDWVWVIVGDLPPAYITTDDAPNPAAALDSYIGAMEQWIQAVLGGEPIDDLIPVNVPPTKEYADQLAARLRLLDELVLSDLHPDLDAAPPN